jgi:hypothetical protein
MFRTNLVVHHQQHRIIYCITQFGTIGTIVLSGESSSYRCTILIINFYSTVFKKIDNKNCASRWLLTHCNMTHGTHNVTLTHCNMAHGTHNVTLTHYNMTHGTHNVKLYLMSRNMPHGFIRCLHHPT